MMEGLLACLEALRFYALLGTPGKGHQGMMIPLAQLLMTYQL